MSMIISSEKLKGLHSRSLQPADLERINEIYENYYSKDFWLPSLEHTLGHSVISNGDRIIGFGMLRLYPEAIILLDKETRLRDRVTALRLLYEEAKLACLRNGYKEIVARIHDNKYASLLAKHLKFEEQDGKIMQVKLEE